MRLLWLADVLRGAGLTVHEYDGWRTRGLESFGPVRGIVCHGTAGSLTSTDEGELRVIAITGSNTATPPIAQLYLSRSGDWWVVASGTCTGVKTGTAGPLEGYSDDAVLQIEAQHATTEPWTDVQYWSYVRGVAALVRQGGWPVSNVVGHYEHQPNEKTDPWFDMSKFRRDVAAVLAGGGEDMFEKGDADRLWNLQQYVDALVRNAPEVTDLAGDPTGIGRRPNLMHAALAEIAAKQQAPVDVAALVAALRPELEAAAEAAVRRVLGAVDGATPTP